MRSNGYVESELLRTGFPNGKLPDNGPRLICVGWTSRSCEFAVDDLGRQPIPCPDMDRFSEGGGPVTLGASCGRHADDALWDTLCSNTFQKQEVYMPGLIWQVAVNNLVIQRISLGKERKWTATGSRQSADCSRSGLLVDGP